MTTTINTINGNEGNNRLTGTSRNDVINGNGGNDKLSGGSGDDTLNGGAGKDELNGGSGNDVLDGGSGSDELEGGSGNDTLIYTLAENNVIGKCTYDEYEGGSGTDTLELRFTRAEWMNTNNQTVLQNYINWASKSGSGCRWDDDFTFRFSNARLEIEDIEKLVVKVDDKIINNVGKKKNVDAVNDTPNSITEDETGVQSIYVLSNDSVDNLVKNLELVSSTTSGTVELVKQDPNNANTWHFKYTPNSAYYQSLNTSQSATETFTYRVSDADGDQDTAEVKIIITGINDAAIITGDISGSVIENGSNSNGGSNNDGGSPIRTGQLSSSDANNGNPFKPIASQLTTYGEFSITSQGLWTYELNNDNNNVNRLNLTQSLIDSFKIYSADNTEQTIDIFIIGANDAAIISDPPGNQVKEDTDVPESGMFEIATFIPISDVDNVASIISGPTPSLSNIGSFNFFDSDSDQGIYKIQNDRIQFLSEGQQHIDYFAVTALDRTQKTISFTITGVNDIAEITGEVTGIVTESGSSNDGGSSTTTGQLTINDIDNFESSFKAEENKTTAYGKFSITSEGVWTYTLDNENEIVNSLNSISTDLKDTFTIKSIDGTPQEIKITINGADDVVNTKPEIEGKGRSANVEELINLDHFKSITAINTEDNYKAKYDFDHVRTGRFLVSDVDVGDKLTVSNKSTKPDEKIGNLENEILQLKDSKGNPIVGKYVVNWIYTVKDSELDPLNKGVDENPTKDQKFIVTINDGTESVDTEVVLHLFGRDEIKFTNMSNENSVLNRTDASESATLIPGNSILYMGAGNDSALASSGSDVIYGESGNDNLTLYEEDSVIFGGIGNDNINHIRSIKSGLLFGENGSDTIIFNTFISSNILAADQQKIYAWGGEGADEFQKKISTTKQTGNWVMDFDSRKPLEGGDKINYFESIGSSSVGHIWSQAKTQLVLHAADDSHLFLSEGEKYYELKVQSSIFLNDPNWYSVLNLVGTNGAEITLDGLFANGNLPSLI